MANADKIACERVPRIAAVLSFPGLRGQLTGSRRKSSATTGYPGRFAPGSAQAKAHPMGPPLPSDKAMFPRNRRERQQLSKRKVYAGPDHPHVAQKPATLEINT